MGANPNDVAWRVAVPTWRMRLKIVAAFVALGVLAVLGDGALLHLKHPEQSPSFSGFSFLAAFLTCLFLVRWNFHEGAVRVFSDRFEARTLGSDSNIPSRFTYALIDGPAWLEGLRWNREPALCFRYAIGAAASRSELKRVSLLSIPPRDRSPLRDAVNDALARWNQTHRADAAPDA